MEVILQSDKHAKKGEIEDIWGRQKNLGFQWSRTELLGERFLFTGNPVSYFERLKLQQDITSSQISKVAPEFIRNEPFVITFLSNK